MSYSFSDLTDILERLKRKLHIAIVYAGNKRDEGAVLHPTHNTRPWKSYETVAHDIANAVQKNGFVHTSIIPENIHLIDTLRKDKVDLVWLNSAGVQGFNPMAHAPSLLEMAGVPYIGHNPLTATVLDHKPHFKRQCMGYDIPTGRFITWDSVRGRLDPHLNSNFKRTFAGYGGPFIIKPANGRASIGVSLVEFDDLSDAVAELYEKTHNVILVEEYFGGDEYCVSVSGPIVFRDGELQDLGVPFVFSEIERVLDKDEKIFTSMDVRPINQDRFRLLDPKNSEGLHTIEKLRSLARTIYLDFNIQTLIRVDIRADRHGNLFVLEANPKPDLKAFNEHAVSLVAAGLDMQGISYEEYIYSLVANKLHYLFLNRSDIIQHLESLL